MTPRMQLWVFNRAVWPVTGFVRVCLVAGRGLHGAGLWLAHLGSMCMYAAIAVSMRLAAYGADAMARVEDEP